MREAIVEEYLVRRVKEHGGVVRKVKWIGRSAAPDRVVMLPIGCLVWVELKASGKAARFPADGHERAQHREHERMRAVGQQVVVLDSFEGVEKLLNAYRGTEGLPR